MKKSLAGLLIIALVAPSFAAVSTKTAKTATVKTVTVKTVKTAVKPAAAKKPAVKTTVVKISKPATTEVKPAVPAKPIDINFKDVTKKYLYYSAIKKAVLEYEIISGYPDNTFRPGQIMAKAEVPGTVGKATVYLEKKYGIPLEFTPTQIAPAAPAPAPAKTTKNAKKPVKAAAPKIAGMTRLELAGELARAVRKVYERYELTLPDIMPKPATAEVKAKTVTTETKTVTAKPAVKTKVVKTKVVTKTIMPAPVAGLSDVKGDQAISDVKLLDYLKVMEITTTVTKATKKIPATKKISFNSGKELTRLDVTLIVSKFIEKCDAIIGKIPADKMLMLKKKYGLVKEVAEATNPGVAKAMSMGKPQAYVSGLYGNVNESASTTNNWMNVSGAALYGNRFQLLSLKGDYEISGKAGYNQLVYLVPDGHGGVTGGVVGENRYDIDLNTVYPIVNLCGFEGKLLLGLKYAALNNPLAATNFTALNAGVATVLPILGGNYLGRAFYSLIPNTAAQNASVIGQPSSLLSYELGTDINLFNTPMMVGYSGETMFINGGNFSRYYNMFFVRYNLI